MTFSEILAALNNGQLVHEQHTEMTVGNKTVLTAVLSPEAVPPSVTGASIGVTGNILAVTLSEPVNGHDGFTLNASGGVVSLTYDSGEGSSRLTYLLSRTVTSNETVTLDYTPGTVTDLVGNALLGASGTPVV